MQPPLARDISEKRAKPGGIDAIGLHHCSDEIVGKCFLQIRLCAVAIHAGLPGVPAYGMAGDSGCGWVVAADEFR